MGRIRPIVANCLPCTALITKCKQLDRHPRRTRRQCSTIGLELMGIGAQYPEIPEQYPRNSRHLSEIPEKY